MRITVEVNGLTRESNVEPRTLLSDYLRHELGLTGTHVGCEHGVCGACTVLVDGEAVRSCLTLAVQMSGRSVRTVEDLVPPGQDLNDIQVAFRKHHALQCGFCTPGILMSLAAEQNRPAPCRADALDSVRGHICRCTGYRGIKRVVEEIFAESDAENTP
ncbi:2-furoyl-CoA dehydrogenase 2Fe-2S iron sulfur subunit [Saccharopolyspora spinosa]|uniref:2-furoyl-CoA dehydrogenase 2Fe-2S iron sulfur subunit n=2 Tax=Saccharopolyspora spinosa TaxID=60894 RepID=A0A2N3Y6F3_SACSN|nr:2-furoyl-CoA dehydrogenase 2Fe-2S iron sulfur subunit [Saccharopolyspora spinosa]